MATSMFYTKTARVIAGIALVFGMLVFLIGLGIATGVIKEPEAGLFLRGKPPGRAIDFGLYTVLIAVVLGVLSEISQSLSSKERSE